MQIFSVLIATFILVFCFVGFATSDEYLGNWSANQFTPNSTGNQFGAGAPCGNGIKNPYSKYGSAYSNRSVNNPFATDAPKLYDSQGQYRGKMSSNPYDPDSISNPYGRYGSEFSPDSVNNPFGPGSPYSTDSPNNKYGEGLKIYGTGSAGLSIPQIENIGKLPNPEE